MREDALGKRQIGGHQERRPEDGVEADDLLADQVQVGGPETSSSVSADRAQVRDQRVEPDIEDVLPSTGTGMPHLIVVRLMERSFRPCLTKLMTSLRFDSGWMKSGCFS